MKIKVYDDNGVLFFEAKPAKGDFFNLARTMEMAHLRCDILVQYGQDLKSPHPHPDGGTCFCGEPTRHNHEETK